jgi:hypothetical protein
MHVNSFKDDWKNLDLRDWERIEMADEDIGNTSFEQVMLPIDTQRFGRILTGGWTNNEVVIEHWLLDFDDGHDEDNWYYRYRYSGSAAGQIYRTLKAALEGHGGQPINEALPDALAAGLRLPD